MTLARPQSKTPRTVESIDLNDPAANMNQSSSAVNHGNAKEFERSTSLPDPGFCALRESKQLLLVFHGSPWGS